MEKLPLFALSPVSAVITMYAQRVGGGINPEVSLPGRLANAIVCYARYLGKAVWPTHLAPMYPHPGNPCRGGRCSRPCFFCWSSPRWSPPDGATGIFQWGGSGSWGR